MTHDFVDILALGASTPLGRDAWSSAAAVRAALSNFSEHHYMLDTAGEPMRAAIAPWLAPDLSGALRFEALLLPAIEQALAPVQGGVFGHLRIALALGLPVERPGVPAGLAVDMLRAAAKRFGKGFGAAATFANGHCAGALALDAAWRKVAQGELDVCVVAGVDSWIDPEALDWLESCDQLHGAGPLNNAWGFVPGEGAGAVLIARSEVTARLGLTPVARVLRVGIGFERHRIKSDDVCIGEGLTVALRAAMAGLPNTLDVTDIYCDMNGEPYRADEYGFACLRMDKRLAAASDFTAPADCWGDVGAASTPLHLALASIAGFKGYANGDCALAWSSSESGERTAIVLATRRGH